LVIVLLSALRLIHPIAPFISEELFQKLKERLGDIPLNDGVDPYTVDAAIALKSSSCMVAPYPQLICKDDMHPEIDHAFDLMEKIVYTIRNIRGEMQLPPGVSTDIFIVGNKSYSHYSIVESNQDIIRALVKVNQLQLSEKEPEVDFSSTGVIYDFKIIIPLPADRVDQEKKRLQKEAEKLAATIDKLKSQLSNKEFVSKAPPSLVQQQQKMLQESEQQLATLHNKLGLNM
jgi:valyl-tRNA synthetase